MIRTGVGPRLRPVFLCGVLSLALVACGTQSAERSWSDLAPESFPYDVVGVAEYPDGELLEGPVDITLGSGKLWVLDGTAGELHMLSGHGDFLRVVGGDGEGPEELRRPSAVVVNGDTVRVLDMGNARIQYFDTTGSHRRTNPYSNVVDSPLFDAALWRGGWIGSLVASDPPAIRLTGQRADTSSALSRAATALGERHAGWDRDRAAAPLSPRLQVLRGELWLLDTFHPVAAVVDRDGAGFTLIEYPLLESTEDDGRRGPAGSSRAAPAGSFGVLPDPRSRDAVYVLTQQMDSDGRQMVVRVDGAGRLVGQVRLPSDLRLISTTVLQDDRVFAVALRGDLEVPGVVQLRPSGEPEQ